MSGAAYLSAFDGVTMVDGTNTKHRSLLAPTAVVVNRLVVLPNGTKINYDGTSDPETYPGTARQHIVGSGASALTNYNNIANKIANRGTLTKTNLAGGTATCAAICLTVTPLASTKPAVNFFEYVVEFELEGEWS